MKKFALIFAAILMFVLLMIPALAADDDGMTFTADKLYSLSKNLEKEPLTFEAVIRIPKGETERVGMIISNYAGNSSTGITLQFNSGKNLELYYELDTPSFKSIRHKFTKIPVSSVATGDWVHITVVKDDAAGRAHAYVNGEFVQTADAATGDYGYFTTELDPPAICIGGDHRSGNAQYFKAEIREIAMYSDIRTADEIKADYANGIKADNDNLMVWHKLSAGTTTSEDLSGNGYDLGPNKSKVNWLKDKEPVTDYAYSFAVVGDTQYIARDNPENMTKYYQWILDNKESKKIECVIGLGDITDSNKTEQWTPAKNSISLLDGKILYTLVRGNHDNAASLNSYLGTDAYYDQLKSRGESGVFQQGKLENAYCTFTVGETKYLIIMLDFGAKDDVLEWAGSVLEKYSDHRAILTTHAYMNSDKTTLDAKDKYAPTTYDPSFNDANKMWDKLASQHENVILVLSGHIPYDNIVTLQQKGKHGNTVTQMLIDPQGLDNRHKDIGSLGMVAMFYFSEDGSKVSVEYYSILHDEYFGKANQFDLVLLPEEPKPAETTAPETTAAPVTTAAPETTTAAPETPSAAPETTVPAASAEPATDSAPGTVWIVVGVAAAVIVAAAAVIIIKKKKK